MPGTLLPISGFCRSQGVEGAPGTGALTPRQRRYAMALAKGATAGQAAKAAGVSERTGRHWRRQRPEMERFIRARQAEDMALGRAVLVSGVAKCSRALVSMGSGRVPADAARITACRVVLDTANGWTDLADVIARLDVLEAQEGRHHGDDR
jgi:hypothetical protein